MALSEFDSLPDTEDLVAESAPMGATPYDSDFLPSQRRYFKELSQDSKLSPLMRTRLFQSNTQLAQQSYMKRAAVEEAGMSIKARQIQFETAKYTLDQAREKAARDRSMLGELSKLQEELFPIMKDTTLDSVAKKDIYSQLGVKWGGVAAVNAGVANALQAANAGLSSQTKDRVTKLDYINAGADPRFLASYETDIGRSLSANEDVPIDVYGAGLYSGKRIKEQEELKARLDYGQAQAKQAGFNTILDAVLEGKLVKNPMDPSKPSNEFEKSATKEALTILVDQSGTPEERKEFQSGNAINQLNIGQLIAFKIKSGTRLPAPPKSARPSLSLGFTTPSK